MPTAAYIDAAKRPGSVPVLHVQVEDVAAQEEVYSSKADWDGSSVLTNVDTTEFSGSVVALKNLSASNHNAITVTVPGPFGSPTYGAYESLAFSVPFDLFALEKSITLRAGVAATGSAGSGTITVSFDIYDAATGGNLLGSTNQRTINVVSVDSVVSDAGEGGDGNEYQTYLSSAEVFTITSVFRVDSSISTIYLRPNVSSISISSNTHLPQYDGVLSASTELSTVPEDAANATLTTSIIDMGSTPANDPTFFVDDTKPNGAFIVCSMRGSTDNFVASDVDLGTVADGDTVTAYRYYKIKADFSTTTGARGQLHEFRLRTTEYRNWANRKNEPVVGTLPYLPEKPIKAFVSEIRLDNPPEVGQGSFKVIWSKDSADAIATGYLRGKSVVMRHGYVGLGSDQYEPLFTGSWFDFSADVKSRIISVEVQDALKKFMKVKLPLETVDASGNKTTTPLTWTAANIMQVMLDIIDELGIPDRFIDRVSFETLRDGDFSTEDYNVTRTVSTPTEAWKMLWELGTLAGVFLVPMPDGRLKPVVYDASDSVVTTVRLRHVDVDKLQGGQKDLYTRQLIYYDVAAGVSDPGESENDYDKALLQINDTAETNWSETAERRFYDKWSASAFLIDSLAHRRETWFSEPRLRFEIKSIPLHQYGLGDGILPGHLLRLEGLLVPVAAASFGSPFAPSTSNLNVLVLKKTFDPSGSISVSVMEIPEPTHFYPSSVLANTGSTSGNIADMQEADGTYYSINEVAGTPGFDIDFTFASVDQDVHQITFRGRYEGNSGHVVKIQVYDNNAPGWIDLTASTRDLPHMTSDYYRVFNLPHPLARFRDGSNNVKVKIHHTTSGSAGHVVYIDQMRLRNQ